MSSNEWFVLIKEKTQAYGRPVQGGFLVREGSTAMRIGSPNEKRNRGDRDRLLRLGTLVPHSDPDLLRFACDHVFTSPSQAGGIVIDGNCSGPSRWRRTTDRKSLKECLGS